MKLLLVVVQDADVNILMDELIKREYRVTKLASSGGFLKSGNTTLFIGVENEQLDDAIKIIESNCKRRKTTTAIINPGMQAAMFQTLPVEIEVGGATVFVIDVDKFIQF